MTFVNQKSRYVFPPAPVTVNELRRILDKMTPGSRDGDGYVAFGHVPQDHPTHAGSLILEVTMEDIFGQISHCAPVEPEVSVPKLGRRHRDRLWADANDLVWYVKDGSWHCDDSAESVTETRGPFRQVIQQ